MDTNFFLLTSPVRPERLSLLGESLKFFFTQLYPESLVFQKKTESPLVSFFLSGDALYSLADPENLQIWNEILSFPPVRIVCDREELNLRGIAIESLKLQFPDQVIDTNTPGADGRPSFWKDLAAGTRQAKPPLPGTLGWFQAGSPYMHRSAWQGIRFLSAAIDERLSVELYAYLDGVYVGHQGQKPADSGNIGKGLADLNVRATASGLTFHAIGCSRSSAARGYNTWDDGRGQVISTCTEGTFRIRDLSRIIDRFRDPHPVLAADAGILHIHKTGPAVPSDRSDRGGDAPPVTIFITKSPYGTGHAAGALSFAVACAHAGILTRVIFLEDGIYALTANHHMPERSLSISIPDLLARVAGSENLQFFAFTPSFQKRGVQKDRSLSAVPDLGYPGLGKILFFPPANVSAGCQRLIIF